jgi:hypothetical protein
MPDESERPARRQLMPWSSLARIRQERKYTSAQIASAVPLAIKNAPTIRCPRNHSGTRFGITACASPKYNRPKERKWTRSEREKGAVFSSWATGDLKKFVSAALLHLDRNRQVQQRFAGNA